MGDSKLELPQHVAGAGGQPAAAAADSSTEGRRLPRETVLLSIPPPAPYDLHVRSLDIGLPSTAPTLATKIAGLVGKEKKRSAPPAAGEDAAKDWIVRDVDAVCKSGEVLALIGGSGSGASPTLGSVFFLQYYALMQLDCCRQDVATQCHCWPARRTAGPQGRSRVCSSRLCRCAGHDQGG